MPVTDSAVVYARLAELAVRLHDPEAMREIRRLAGLYRWEYARLPNWVKEAVGIEADWTQETPVTDEQLDRQKRGVR
jgi:hypothetical protein